jgi:hypothetical protein
MVDDSRRVPGFAAVFRPIAFLCLVVLLAGACAQGGPGGRQDTCDDGGDGGVLIDGICL